MRPLQRNHQMTHVATQRTVTISRQTASLADALRCKSSSQHSTPRDVRSQSLISKSSAECLRSLAPPTWPLPTEHTTMAMECGDNGGMADGQVCTLCGDTFAEVSRYKAFPMCNTCYDAAHQADMTVARCVAAVAARMVSTCDWSCPHALSFDWLSPSSL
jgi:hypothetical protein